MAARRTRPYVRRQKPSWVPPKDRPEPRPGQLDTERGRQDYAARLAAWESIHDRQ